jgi:hypothetical protein
LILAGPFDERQKKVAKEGPKRRSKGRPLAGTNSQPFARTPSDVEFEELEQNLDWPGIWPLSVGPDKYNWVKRGRKGWSNKGLLPINERAVSFGPCSFLAEQR